MRLFVVRHVKAGDRSRWDGPDHERPISKTGRRQANALADRLASENVSAVISSPSVRCVQSLQPLAERAGLKVEEDDRLGEGSSIEDSLAVARNAPDRAVLCSHGDVIPDLLDALMAQGCRLKDELRWQKASTWVLSWDRDRLVKGRYLSPPT